eukprot:gene9939-2260_t
MSVWDEVFTYDALAHAIAGTAGGQTSMSLFYPLDHIRTYLQVNGDKNKSTFENIKDLIEKEGIASLYSGLRPVLTSLACSNFVYFYSYNMLKTYVKSRTELTTAKNLLVAAVAGVINVYVTCPLWVVSTQLRLQQKSEKKRFNGIIDGIQTIAREDGITSLWNGALASTMLVSNPTIQFVTYDKLKSYMDKSDLSSWEIFLLGSLSKAIATVLTYPIQVAQSNMRSKHKSTKDLEIQKQKPKYANTIDCLMKLFKENGIYGWFKGLDVKLLQTVLNCWYNT